MIGGAVDRSLPRCGAEHYWGDTLPLLRSADAVIANLECPITDYPHRWPRLKTWRFHASPAGIEILRAGNVRFVNLANNHSLDYQAEGLLDTMRHLDQAGIGHAGGGGDAAAAAAPKLLALPDLTLGLIGMTDNLPAYAATAERPGTHYMPIDDRPERVTSIAERVERLRARGAELVVLSAHLGLNMMQRPERRFRRFARAVVEAGIDLFHGHSAHLFQAVEPHGAGLVLYDTGNFLDDYWKFPFLPTLWTFVFLVEIETGRPRRLLLYPVEIGPLAVALARGAAFERICRRMQRLSAARGCILRPHPDGLELALENP